MKKRNKVLIYSMVCILVICAVIGGMWGGIKEWQNSIHYVGVTEVPLSIAKTLQNIRYVNGEGNVEIINITSGNVVIEYNFYSTRSYDYLTTIDGRCNKQLGGTLEMMLLFSFLGSCLCCGLVGLNFEVKNKS